MSIRWGFAVALSVAACSRDLAVPQLGAAPAVVVDGRITVEEAGTGRVLPAPGARVEVAGTGLAVVADDQGLFSIANPPPPPRALLVTWSSTGAGGAIDRQLNFRSGLLDQSAGAVHLGDVLLAADAEILGRVLLADKARDSIDLVGSVVFVPRYPYSAVTGEGGAFLLPHLPSGRLSLAVYRPGYGVASVDAVELAAGAQVTLQEVALSPHAGAPVSGSIQGSAQRPDGSAAAGATVTAAPAQGGTGSSRAGAALLRSAVSANGTFKLDGVPAGAWVVTLSDAAAGTTAQIGGVLVAPGLGGPPATDLGAVTLSKAAPPPVTTGGAPPKPLARPGADLVAAPASPVLLDGRASDGTALVFHWSASDAGVAFSVNDSQLAARTSFIAPNTSTPITITLTVTDAFGQSSLPATLRVFVNHPPIARLTAPAITRSNTPTLLDASTSADTDPGDVLTFTFLNVASPSGATVTFAAGSVSAQKTFSASLEGTYQFQVIVDDGHLATLSSPVTVTVSDLNHAPVANVSGPTTVNENVTVTLDGSTSFDPDPGDTLTFAWTALNGAPPLTSTTTPVTHFTSPGTAGTLSYQLVVTDNHGLASAPSIVSVGVLATPPPVAAVQSTNPINTATSVSTTSTIQISYSGSLNASSVVAGSVQVTIGTTAIPGSPSYADVTQSITFQPDVPLSQLATVSVQVASVTDFYGRATAPYAFSFTTNAPNWADISPADPLRSPNYSGAPDGGAHFSQLGLAPAIGTGAGGSYLLGVELGNLSLLPDGGTTYPGYPTAGNATYGGMIRHWDLGQADAGTFDGGVHWNVATPLEAALTNANGCCSGFGLGGPTFADAPFWRSTIGVEPNGLPDTLLDFGDSKVQFTTASTSSGFGSQTNVTVSRDFGSVANDGLGTYVAFRGCDCASNSCGGTATDGGAYANPAFSDLYLIPTGTTSINFSGEAVLITTPLPEQSSCSGFASLSFDPWVGPPALTGASGTLYLLLAYKPSQAASYAIGLYTRAHGDTTFPIPGPLTDPNHLGGALNQSAVNLNSFTAAAMAPKGPVLVFLEGSGSGARYRATRYDLATQTFVDPLTNSTTDAAGGSTGSSVIAPLQLDGKAFLVPGSIAVTVVGATPYVAWQAFSADTQIANHRVFAAHADAAQHKWILDSDARNVDGALNVHASSTGVSCDASPPSVSTVDGLPTVAWGEQCPIPNAQGGLTANYLVVHRLQ